MSVKEFINSTKTASSVGAATTTAGLGTMMEWIPSDIGKLATLVGIGLSIVLIYTHLSRGHIEYRKTKLEIDILEQKERERVEELRQRKKNGLPSRRKDDVLPEPKRIIYSGDRFRNPKKQ
jgi:hypothetical protein